MEWRSLPGDLVDDILSRVPAKSLARLRLTSKQWTVLLRSGSLAKMHSAKAPKKDESLIITLIRSRVCLVRINLRDSSVKIATQFYLKDPLSNSNSSQVDIPNVFHCDGLLLCTTKDNRLVVWNPCSGETKWIQPRNSYEESDYYALGYDNSSPCKRYKILRVNRHQVIPIKNEYEIYDLTSDSWRVVGVATDWFLPGRGVSLKGNTYWVSTPAVRAPYADFPAYFLLSFDFSTEVFQSLSLPHPFPHSTSALSVVREEQLCLLGSGSHDRIYESDLHVWVLASTGSWNKSLEVKDNNKRGRRYLRHFSKGVSFVADEKNKVVVYLNTNNVLDVVREKKQILEQEFGGDLTFISPPSSVLLNYVPSLAQIQQGTPLGRHKRKAQSK